MTEESADDDYRCRTCGFRLWLPVTKLQYSLVGLYDDARFPGRCLVSLKAHYDDLVALPATTLCGFMSEVQLVSRAVMSVVAAERINMAVFGNRDSHVHAHVVPRFRGDPCPTLPPWNDPRPLEALGAKGVTRLMTALRRELATVICTEPDEPVT